MTYTFILLTVLAAPQSVTPTQSSPLEIQADRMEVSQKTGRVLFTGHVHARRGALRLRCDRLDAEYQDGKLLGMTASNNVRVKSKDFEASARKASFDQATGILTLSGKPRLTRGKSIIEGQSIRIWIDDERVIVEKAKATLDSKFIKSLRRKEP
jgi:lipopolysaccharide transport protein LptA